MINRQALETGAARSLRGDANSDASTPSKGQGHRRRRSDAVPVDPPAQEARESKTWEDEDPVTRQAGSAPKALHTLLEEKGHEAWQDQKLASRLYTSYAEPHIIRHA